MPDVVTGPRWSTPATAGSESHGDRLDGAFRLLGHEPHEWQHMVGQIALEVAESGHYRYEIVGVSVPRQTGKTELMRARAVAELSQPNRKIVFTAQDRGMAFRKWNELVAQLEDLPKVAANIKKVQRRNGNEILEMRNGSKMSIFTPSEDGVRGETVDLVLIDEAMTHELWLAEAVSPTMITKPSAQMWLFSTPGRGTLWSHYRKLGHAGTPGVAWFEWSPTDDDCAIDDPVAWAEAIPTLDQPNGITSSKVSNLVATMDPTGFRREHLNQHLEHTPDDLPVDPQAWAKLGNSHQTLDGPLTLGVDVAADGSKASIVAVDNHQRLELIDQLEPRRLASRLADLSTRHHIDLVVWDAKMPTVPGLNDYNTTTTLILDHQSGPQACVAFVDAVADATVGHRAQNELTAAVEAARRRKIGDRWVFERRWGTDTSAALAATWALWGVSRPNTKPSWDPF